MCDSFCEYYLRLEVKRKQGLGQIEKKKKKTSPKQSKAEEKGTQTNTEPFHKKYI